MFSHAATRLHVVHTHILIDTPAQCVCMYCYECLNIHTYIHTQRNTWACYHVIWGKYDIWPLLISVTIATWTSICSCTYLHTSIAQPSTHCQYLFTGVKNRFLEFNFFPWSNLFFASTCRTGFSKGRQLQICNCSEEALKYKRFNWDKRLIHCKWFVLCCCFFLHLFNVSSSMWATKKKWANFDNKNSPLSH